MGAAGTGVSQDKVDRTTADAQALGVTKSSTAVILNVQGTKRSLSLARNNLNYLHHICMKCEYVSYQPDKSSSELF